MDSFRPHAAPRGPARCRRSQERAAWLLLLVTTGTTVASATAWERRHLAGPRPFLLGPSSSQTARADNCDVRGDAEAHPSQHVSRHANNSLRHGSNRLYSVGRLPSW